MDLQGGGGVDFSDFLWVREDWDAESHGVSGPAEGPQPTLNAKPCLSLGLTL